MEGHRLGSVEKILSFTDDNGIRVHIKAQTTSDISAMNTANTMPLEKFLEDCRNAPLPRLNPVSPQLPLYSKRNISVDFMIGTLNSGHVSELCRLVAWAGTVWGGLEQVTLVGGGYGSMVIIQVEDHRPSSRDEATLLGLRSQVSRTFREVQAARGGVIVGLRMEFLGNTGA
ncbi:hypothetical protein PVAG01_04823 [Phlyctema vagabunda]|uniref:Uncharacterized protein n=1 Tax=Phlyctema vagabunda TaxID=108571 RepID=A0ABR4PIA6_9HELO